MSSKQPPLFDADGCLLPKWFDSRAWAVLEECVEWLQNVGRSLFLPIDLVVVLLRANHEELGEQLAKASRGSGGTEDILHDLETLARRVDRELGGKPELRAKNFSLGFTGILEDALSWAREAGWDRISEDDLARVVRWRAEVQESASVRWAVRQLAAPGGERLFDAEGVLKPTAFVDQTWKSMQEAMQLASQSGMPFLGTPHLIAVLCSIRDSILWRVAESCGVDPRKLREELLRIVGVRTPPQSVFLLSRRTMTPRLVRMLTYASDRAHNTTGRIVEIDIIEGFLKDGGSSLELIKALGLESELRSLLGDPKVLQGATVEKPERRDPTGSVSSSPMLDLLGRDLTADAKAGKLPIILGRERELTRIINVLMRSEQRNPLLTGEAGVGKTALAIALARRIQTGHVPDRLKDYRVVEINGASLIGGTSYRGDLEARIKALLSEAQEKVILFVDEAHAVFAPRSGSGQPAEVPNHFKAALATGDIAVVAATTEGEYHRWIEQDPALKRRFERIDIPEPTKELTHAILEGLVSVFEEDYEVTILPEAVKAAVELSVNYLPEQRLPDKAKKLLMDAAISTSIECYSDGPSQRKMIPLQRDTTDIPLDTPDKKVCPPVGREEVAKQITLKSGIPLDRLVHGEKGWWVGLSERLRPYVAGQDSTVSETARALVSGRLRAGMSRGPQAVFVFVGPPAVGKVELAKALAKEVYADDRALIRLNMSDFQEGHALSRLIGTPPGYVGYQDEDALVTPLRRKPSSVVLLEDFDCSHPRIRDRFLALFEDGAIADTRGMIATARHAIFVLTVNTPAGNDEGHIGFSSSSTTPNANDRARHVLERHAPELARKLKGYPHHVILFRSAASDQGLLLSALFEQRLARFRASLLETYGLQLDIEPSIEEGIRNDVCALTDARDLDQLFTIRLIEPVTHQLLRGHDENTIVIGAATPLSADFPDVSGEVNEEETVTPLPESVTTD